MVLVKTELQNLVEKINSNPVHIANEKDRIFQINLENSNPLQIIIKNGRVEVSDGTPYESAVTLTLSESNFSKLLNDDLNTTIAFMTGGLKVDGSIGLALKLQEIVKKYK